MDSQSHRKCAADSFSCRHLYQVGLSVSPNLKSCPIRSYLNTSFVLLAEGPAIKPFACLSPIMDSQYFLWFLSVQSLIAILATPIEMLQVCSHPMNGCSYHDTGRSYRMHVRMRNAYKNFDSRPERMRPLGRQL